MRITVVDFTRKQNLIAIKRVENVLNHFADTVFGKPQYISRKAQMPKRLSLEETSTTLDLKQGAHDLY